jgi:hypothetical protein
MSFTVELKNTKMEKTAAVVINLADSTSTHSPMIIYAMMRSKTKILRNLENKIQKLMMTS